MATIYCDVCRKVRPEEGSTLGMVKALSEPMLVCADCRTRIRVQSIETMEDNYSRWDERGELPMIVEKRVSVNGFDRPKMWVRCPGNRVGIIDAQWIPQGQTEATHWRVRFDRVWFPDEQWREMSGEDPNDTKKYPIRAVYIPFPKSETILVDSSEAPKPIRNDPAVGPRQTPTKEQIEDMTTGKTKAPRPVSRSAGDPSKLTVGSYWATNKKDDLYRVVSVSSISVDLVWTGMRLVEGTWVKHGAPGYKREATPSGLLAQYRQIENVEGIV